MNIQRRSLIKMLCAFGAGMLMPVQALSARKKYTVRVLQYRCVGCKDCSLVCMPDAISFINKKAVVDPEACTGCLLCPAVCSYGAIKKWEISETV